MMENISKKVLLISHNPLSRVNNNGKTLVSLFEGVPDDNIYQIYLNGDIPDYSNDCHYLQLNEMQILRSMIRGKNLCCREVDATAEKVCSATIQTGSFGIHAKRLAREWIWKFTFWKPKLKAWLEYKHFDVVFFMAGDGLFAYDVYRFVMEHVSAKGCLFFTDDYIIGRNSYSPIASLRQQLLKRKIRKTLLITKELYVISEEMRKAYRNLFGMDSYVARNFSVEKKRGSHEQVAGQSDALTMVYAGGLHYNRWKVLAEIANALQKINQSSGEKCYLKVYSSQNLPDDITRCITVENASTFMGSATASEIADIYANADILVHVESFDKQAIASTKYSFSTKIPEYLSAGKCVLAVGPAEVASIQYLSDFACVINDNDKIPDVLSNLVADSAYRDFIKSNCEEHYEVDFSRKKQADCLKNILSM